MTIIFLESGTDATHGLDWWSGSVGTVASSTAQAFTGPRSLSLANGSSAVYKSGIGTATGRGSFRIYPGANGSTDVFARTWEINGAIDFYIQRNASNTISLVHNGATIATSSTAVPNSAWTQISFAYTRTSSSVNHFKVWITLAGGSPSLEIDATNFTWSTDPAGLAVYFRTGAASGTTYLDDIYLDDDSSLTDPGDIRITAKLPAADNTSGFDSGIGSGTNRYDRVSERPLSVSNGWQHAANSDAQENYALQSASQGDVDITGATILGYTGWMYAKRGAYDAALVQSLGTVQDKSSNHTTTTNTVTANSTSGNAIVVSFACDDDTGGTTATCADSKGNTYSAANSIQAATTGNRTGVRTAVFIATNATALVAFTDTVTVTHASVGASAMVVSEVKGIQTSSPKDVSNSNSDSGSNTPTSGSTGTLSQAEEIVFAAIGVEAETSAFGTLTDLGVNQSVGTAGAGAASNISVQSQYKIVNATTALSGGFNPAGESRDWTSVIVGYKAIAGYTSYGDPKLMLNGTEYSKTLTISNALYTEIVTSASYPSNAAGIGMRSSGTTADSFLYECGALIAYTPAGASAAAVQRSFLRELRGNFSRNIRANFQRVRTLTRRLFCRTGGCINELA